MPVTPPEGSLARQVGLLTSARVMTVAPPYTTLQPLDCQKIYNRRFPLGTIVKVTSQSALGALGTLTMIVHSHPWIVPCLALPEGERHLGLLIPLISELKDRITVLDPSERIGQGEIDWCTAATTRRPIPNHDVLAAFISDRLGKPDLFEPLQVQFLEMQMGMPAKKQRSVAYYSRLFAKHSVYTARDWRAIARLSLHL